VRAALAILCGAGVACAPVATSVVPAQAASAPQAAPEAVGVTFERAVAALDQGRLEEAERGFADVLARAPRQVEAQYNLGVVAQRRGQLEQARQAWARARAIVPEHVPSLLALGSALRAAGRAAEAVPLFEAALEADATGGDPEVACAAAQVFRAAGRPVQAEAAAVRALARHPELGCAWLALGRVSLDQGQLGLAGLRLEGARARHVDSAELHTALGVLASRRGDTAAALAALERALSREPDSLPALQGLGVLALGARDFPRASSALSRAAALAPGSAPLQAALGWALDAQKGREAALGVAAGEAFARAVELGSTEEQLVCAAGWAFVVHPAGRERARVWLSRCRALPSLSAPERQRIDARLAVLAASPGAAP
jgi:Tfp pilus assembly protein PilF